MPKINLTGPAYQKSETRYGSPLEYVAEKQRHALEHLHLAYNKADLEDAKHQMKAAFHYSIVACLALNCLIDDWGQDIYGLVDRLLHMSFDEFREWLDLVDAEGSVLGHLPTA